MHGSTHLEKRKHPRARVTLPLRVRWLGPLGMRLEVTQTIDASRDGVLFRRGEPCDPGARVWVALPFDANAAAFVQTETPACVVRVEEGRDGNFYVGLRLELPLESLPADGKERRQAPRLHFSLPVFVRPSGTPWPEESMSQDVSRGGLRFETFHAYTAGETVLAQIPWGDWAKSGEMTGRVLRVEVLKHARDTGSNGHSAGADTGAMLASVAVQWLDPGAKSGGLAAKSTRRQANS